MSFSRLSRRIALVAAPALAVGALAAVPAPSYAVADPTPATNGAAWLAGELTDGVIVGEYGPDYGLTIDAALAMLAVDAEPRAVGVITSTLRADLESYITGEAFGDTGSLYAGAVAKAAAFVTEAGADPTDFGGRNLVANVEQVASDEAGIQGRLQDVSNFGDFANTIGQSFAVRALDAAASPETDAVTRFLLAQQCSAGFFRLSFAAADAADQTCDADPSATGSTDVTAFAVMALLSQTDDPMVAAAVDAAAGWLQDTQGADGSWGGDAPTTAPNANSTGLAAWALSEVGTPVASAAAAKGAIELRRLQADDFAPCATKLSDETGAIAYDDDAVRSARSNGIGGLRDQFRRTTAQALPALLVAPAGVTGDRSSFDFVRPRATKTVKVNDLAPGQTVCIGGGAIGTLINADADGTAKIGIQMPDAQVKRAYEISLTDGAIGTITYQSLTPKTFKLRLKKAKVPAQRKQKVIVKGLAVGESVRVKYQGKVVERGTSGDNHRFTTKFRVGNNAGKQKVRVIGEFGNRNATEKFRVVTGR